jgi:phytoene dehydrogenase-like protein
MTSARTSYDVIVIGAGQNGLVAAGYLAKAGKRVLVLEARAEAGGAQSSDEFHPGFRVDSAFHQTGWLDPAIASDLSLGSATEGLLQPEAAVLNLTDRGHFVLRRGIREAAEEIAKHSRTDAERWESFARLMYKLSGFLQHVYGVTPPQLTSTRPGDLLNLLGLGRRVRGMGKTDMIEFLRILPMSVAELLDDWFETDGLKGALGAAGITGIMQGPRSAGTAFVMLHHQVGNPAGVFRAGSLRRGGVGSLATRLAQAARGLGAEILTGKRVARIRTVDGRAVGVTLENGDEIAAQQIVSTVDPRKTMLGMVEPTELEPEYARAMQNIRYRGVSAKVNLALGELPRFSGVEGNDQLLKGIISLSPNLDYLEKAYDDAKHGRVSARPYLEAVIPSLEDPTVAPAGRHVMSIWVQYAPYRMKGEWDAAARESLGDRVVDCLTERAPNLKSAILHRQVLTPKDLGELYGVTEGNLYHGEMGLDQILFMRPVPGWGHHRTPIDQLYLGGSGTHPGGGIVGGAGRLAARELMKAS